MYSSYRNAVEDYEKETGVTYDDAAYPTPESVPQELRKLVADIKMYGAMARLNEIHNELAEYVDDSGIRIARTLEDKEHLMNEMKECKEMEDVWSKVMKT